MSAADAALQLQRSLSVLSQTSAAMGAESPLAVRLRAVARVITAARHRTVSLDVDGLGRFLAIPGGESTEAGGQSDFAITADDEAFGTLHVTHAEPLSSEEILTLAETGTCIALWLQAARRHDHDRELAEHLQSVMLPQHLPSGTSVEFDAAYRPATREHIVGGDWYDAFALPDGRIAFSIGDVAGHGLPAAVVMGEVRQAFRAAAIESALARAGSRARKRDRQPPRRVDDGHRALRHPRARRIAFHVRLRRSPRAGPHRRQLERHAPARGRHPAGRRRCGGRRRNGRSP